mmetsp:Transcript_12946/g.39522  ORF Transcript_12946/g.39522 Transcript_12946/m.39522 type:complete len:94 (-) Transcript_12946:928-1209(-)
MNRARRGAGRTQRAGMEEVRQMLDSPLRVGLTDGRIVFGRFACLDKQRNILLTDARESRRMNGDAASERRERHLGTVLIPRRWVATCHCAVIT